MGSYRTYIAIVSVLLLAILFGYQNAIYMKVQRNDPSWLSDELEKIELKREMSINCLFQQESLDTTFEIFDNGSERRFQMAMTDQTESFTTSLDGLEKSLSDDGTVIYHADGLRFEVPPGNAMMDSKKQVVSGVFHFESSSMLVDAPVKCEIRFQ